METQNSFYINWGCLLNNSLSSSQSAPLNEQAVKQTIPFLAPCSGYFSIKGINSGQDSSFAKPIT